MKDNKFEITSTFKLKPLMSKAIFLFLVVFGFMGFNKSHVINTYYLTSPDRTIKIVVNTNAEKCEYSISLDGKEIISHSSLGLILGTNDTLGNKFKILNVDKKSYDSTWINSLGKSREVRNNYKELHLQLQELTGRKVKFGIIFRAYNNGVAFRYELPSAPGFDSFIIKKELSTFCFKDDYPCYSGHNPGYSFNEAQEWNFDSSHLSDIMPDSVIGDPLLIKTPQSWIALTEADLENWSGMWLSRLGKIVDTSHNVTLVSQLSPRHDGKGLVIAATPQKSPWRVFMIGRKPGDLIESNIISNLNPPCKLSDVSWIRPGVMAWDHWWSGDVEMNTATIEKYIQLASDMGWPYQLIDWQWYGQYDTLTSDITKPAPSVDMKEILRFAKKKNVREWVWLYWKDVERNNAYEKAFALYEKWGLAGIKIDFMNRNDQQMVDWYHKITIAAAQHRLLVDLHGAYVPTGMERTYPNQITREGVLGNEYNRWSRSVTSHHKIMLAFTRFLTGPGDFTPGGFLNRQPAAFQPDESNAEVQGTRCSELALFVIYNSPIQVACDAPSHYKNQPGADFLKIVPTVWDETKVLRAEVGNYIVEARRKGNSWFIGAMTDSTARNFLIPLHFLKNGNYKIKIWQDAKDSNIHAEHLSEEQRIVTANDQLDISMVLNGGYVAQLIKE